MADLKKVYAAIDEQTALAELESFDEKWGNKYPKIAISWRDNWATLSTYFNYPQADRTLIYTTNAIEGFNRQLRQVSAYRKMEDKLLPPDIDYNELSGLRIEARQKLSKIRPRSLGQAGRISGVSPADVSVLMIYLEQQK